MINIRGGLAALIIGSAVGVGALTGCDERRESLDVGQNLIQNVSPVETPVKPYITETPKAVQMPRGDYSTNNFSKDSEDLILARMLFGEARNCSKAEKIAIAYTAINRANDGKKWNGSDVKGSILAKWQYSCFNENDPNRTKLMNPQKYDSKSFDECLNVAQEVLSGKHENLNFGQTHYHTLNVNPKWAGSHRMTNFGRINTEGGLSKHLFYREN